MSRVIKLVIALAVIVAALFYLESRSGERPVAPREQAVDLNALPK